ncbi:MAG: hypothetical protein CMJ78_14635 [Planctomycetaceae bacterium]|nr:hypothetical protein [Planctomycetaceae bacterium]
MIRSIQLLVAVACVSWGTVSAEEGVVAVDQLEKAVFRRVPGPAGKGSCLTTGKGGSWNSQYVGSPTVVFDDGKYWMWYVGGHQTDDAAYPYKVIEQIGGATSLDGLTWKPLNNGKPVLSLGPEGSADDRGLAHPYVLKVGDRFFMWYGAIDGRSAKDLGLTPQHVRIEQTCLASSRDGVHWKRENEGRPVMPLGKPGSVDSIQVTGMHILKVNRSGGNIFRMWYGAYNGDHTLAVAESNDGLKWKRTHGGKPITGLQGGAQGQLGPSVHFDGKRYFMLYCGDVGGQWKTYSAVSDDGFHFRQLNSGRPVLGTPQKGNFDTAGVGKNHSVHASQMIFAKGRIRTWYTGEESRPAHHQRIGLMEAILSAKPTQ